MTHPLLLLALSFPPTLASTRPARCQIQQTTQNTHGGGRFPFRRGRGPGRGRGRGRGGRGGHGHHNRYVTTCNAAQVQNDSRMSQLTDGAMIEIHLAFRFPQDIWVAMTQADRDYVITACHQHWASRTAQQVTIEILTDAMSQIRQLTNNTTPNQVRTNTPQSVAQVTTNTNNTITLHGIMGRRNSQNNKRACHS